jgi:hypothetical protein
MPRRSDARGEGRRPATGARTSSSWPPRLRPFSRPGRPGSGCREQGLQAGWTRRRCSVRRPSRRKGERRRSASDPNTICYFDTGPTFHRHRWTHLSSTQVVKIANHVWRESYNHNFSRGRGEEVGGRRPTRRARCGPAHEGVAGSWFNGAEGRGGGRWPAAGAAGRGEGRRLGGAACGRRPATRVGRDADAGDVRVEGNGGNSFAFFKHS